jgi:hypothetical protein
MYKSSKMAYRTIRSATDLMPSRIGLICHGHYSCIEKKKDSNQDPIGRYLAWRRFQMHIPAAEAESAIQQPNIGIDRGSEEGCQAAYKWRTAPRIEIASVFTLRRNLAILQEKFGILYHKS